MCCTGHQRDKEVEDEKEEEGDLYKWKRTY
jgi:hypothetical protein